MANQAGPERRLRIFIYARILVSFLFLASTILLNYQDPTVVDSQLRISLIRLMTASFIFSAVSNFVLKFQKYHLFITYLQAIWDILFVTVLLLLTGGILSPYSFLYLLSIMNAGVLLGRKEALYTASLCGILYGAIVDFQYFGILTGPGLYQSDALDIGAIRIFYTIFLNLIGFFLTALITGYLYEKARESENALRTKSVDYEELYQLNTTIVKNLESGLLTVTSSGKIRVFNRYAEELTGKSQAEVYDTPLENVFPGFADRLLDSKNEFSSELEFESIDKKKMILGYNAVPFTDLRGDLAGIIINFKDLTTIKQMEAALKKADRLAVIGELSARMAHEIRNPLAAMSGSVQLLAEQGSIADSDRRLLSIVVREADRLNTLITEFLTYARPALPHKEPINFRQFVDDTCMFILSDRRFNRIKVHNLVLKEVTICADANQLRQVLVNLLNNAAEAMQNGGGIDIESSIENRAKGDSSTTVAVITVTDTGPGIKPGTEAHLFEPFWTTKPEGTGLGLAVNHRIIEAHGGTISAETPSAGGCRFRIVLPV